MDGLPDRLADGARLPEPVRPQAERPVRLGARWRRSSSLGLFDFRRWRRIVHLDLLVLLSFGISEIFFNAANIGVSVPLAYPPLVYLLARMIWIGFRGAGDGLRPSAPTAWLAIGAAFLLGFRIALNIADSGVIDVGYAGVIGADHITHGQTVWGLHAFPSDNPFGDTYGPFNYYAYVPFELLLPWHGTWDDLPAAHAAAIFFDLATVAGLFVLGRRLAGNRLGVILGFAWAAYPFTDYALQSNSNDTLIAALLVWALVVFSSPVKRGALLALATLAKFAPLALAPLFAAGRRGVLDRPDPAPPRRPRRRALALFSIAFLGGVALMLALPAIDPGLASFYDRTVKSQVNRTSPFSIWGQDHSLEWLQTVVKAFAVGLALLVAFVPRRRTAAADRGPRGRRPDRRPADRRALVLSLHPLVLRLGDHGSRRSTDAARALDRGGPEP